MENYILETRSGEDILSIFNRAKAIARGLNGFEFVEFKIHNRTYMLKTLQENENLILYAGFGVTIDKFIAEAKELAGTMGFGVAGFKCIEFEFNGRLVLVNEKTNIDNLMRDYGNSWTMEWKSIGPEPADNYSQDVIDELERRKKQAKIEAEAERKAQEEADRKEKELFLEITKGVEMEFSDKKGWDDWKAKNDDPYGACIFEYAEGWAKLMQVHMEKGQALKDCAEQCSFMLGFLGITGAMYGAAVSTLAQTWKHGEELRKWHNKEYGHEGDGVVNPAVLTISDKE